jgi:hypothetical protein
MAKSPAWPWRAFNTIMQVSGVVAALVGSGLLVWVGLLILHPTILHPLHGVATDRNLALPLLMAGAWFLIFGICILWARTYRPDLGDAASLVDPVGVKLQQYYPPSRTWWTGDPKPVARSVRSSAINPVRPQTEPKSFRSPAGESGFSSKIRKILGAVLVAVGFAGFVHLSYLHFDYGARLPSSPEPTIGRVVPFYANHGRVYGTAEERARLKQAEFLGELGVVLAMVGMYSADEPVVVARSNPPNARILVATSWELWHPLEVCCLTSACSRQAGPG